MKRGQFLTVAVLLWSLGATQAQAADTFSGAKIYNRHCVSCHGSKGAGAMPGMSDFRRSGSLMRADADLARSIEKGAGMMPAFRGLLSPNEILDVIAHLRTFR